MIKYTSVGNIGIQMRLQFGKRDIYALKYLMTKIVKVYITAV